jgi:hypothetical protein
MHSKDIIAAIGRMPREFRRREDVSMIALLKESGYLDCPDEVTIPALQAHFGTNSEDLEGWVLNSLDNRGSPAWYIAEPNGSSAKWLVGHYPGEHREYFDSGAEACAVYVRRWLEATARFTEHAV